MTVKEFLASIDPVESHWDTTSAGHWTNTVTGAKYDSTDIVQAMIDQYNATQKAAGKPPYIPGITPVPDAIKVTPGGTGDWLDGSIAGVDPPNYPEPTVNRPWLDGSIAGVTGGSNAPSSTWNNGSAGTPGSHTGTPGFGAPMQWSEHAGSGSGGPYHTGQALQFSPFGTPEALSSEILRYGGRPNSGQGGSWSGIATPSMVSPFSGGTHGTGGGGTITPWVNGGSDPAGQTLPGGGSYDTSGTTKEQMAARAKALQLQMQAQALRDYLATLQGGGTGATQTPRTGTGYPTRSTP